MTELSNYKFNYLSAIKCWKRSRDTTQFKIKKKKRTESKTKNQFLTLICIL